MMFGEEAGEADEVGDEDEGEEPPVYVKKGVSCMADNTGLSFYRKLP